MRPGTGRFGLRNLRATRPVTAEVTRSLKQAGWRVVRVWECALARKRSAATVRRIAKAVTIADH